MGSKLCDCEILRFASAAEKRQAEAARIREKYPDRIPVRQKPAETICRLIAGRCEIYALLSPGCVQVIVEKAERSEIPDIDKKK